MEIMAAVATSAAEPWMGVLMAARKAWPLALLFDPEASGKYLLLPNMVVTYPNCSAFALCVFCHSKTCKHTSLMSFGLEEHLKLEDPTLLSSSCIADGIDTTKAIRQTQSDSLASHEIKQSLVQQHVDSNLLCRSKISPFARRDL